MCLVFHTLDSHKTCTPAECQRRLPNATEDTKTEGSRPSSRAMMREATGISPAAAGVRDAHDASAVQGRPEPNAIRHDHVDCLARNRRVSSTNPDAKALRALIGAAGHWCPVRCCRATVASTRPREMHQTRRIDCEEHCPSEGMHRKAYRMWFRGDEWRECFVDPCPRVIIH